MGSYINREIGKPNITEHSPFEIIPSGDKFYVGSGRCFSTFSYGFDSLIPVGNLYTPLNIPRDEIIDYCVYIDFTILPNLQISGAQVKATKVGSKANEANNEWVDYPDQYRIRPFDIKDSNGKITQFVDGKQQSHAYLLLGRFSEQNPIKEPYKTIPVTGGTPQNLKTYYLSQYASTDVFVFQNQISGTAISFPMPYFGAPYYKTAEEQTA